VIEYKKADSDNPAGYINFKFNNKNAPDCFMTLRPAGSMGRNTDRETPDRKKILNKLGASNLFTLKQTHSRTVYNAEDITENKVYEGDGLYTFSRDKQLAVTVADCMPIFFYGSSENVFGVLHSGWKGTGISIEALKTIKGELKGDLSSFEFILGPSIGPCCYEVDSERAELFRKLYGSESVLIRRDSSNKNEYVKDNNNDKNTVKDYQDDKASVYGNSRSFLDLRKANTAVLEKEGIKNITVYENCTCCDKNFYSFRGDGAKEFQLMLALIGYFR